jgi:hypothetical protein
MAEYLYLAIQREQQLGASSFEDATASMLAQRRPSFYPPSGYDFPAVAPLRQVNPVTDSDPGKGGYRR